MSHTGGGEGGGKGTDEDDAGYGAEEDEAEDDGCRCALSTVSVEFDIRSFNDDNAAVFAIERIASEVLDTDGLDTEVEDDGDEDVDTDDDVDGVG